VEVANKTFKARLCAAQKKNPNKGWVDLLSDIAWVINTTRPDSLPHGTTPYEVWLGRKPPQIPDEELHQPEALSESIATPEGIISEPNVVYH
jgi:hypothetical protein